MNQKLSESFVKSINAMNWLLHEVTSFDELRHIGVVANSILLIDEIDFSQQHNIQQNHQVFRLSFLF